MSTWEQVVARGSGARHINAIVLHTVGDTRNEDSTAAAIRSYHTAAPPHGRGWHDIGYHFFIRQSGFIELGRPLSRCGAHTKGFNLHTVGICCAGDGDLADFTAEQYDSLFDLCWTLCEALSVPHERVLGHREVGAFGAPDPRKTCPGVRVNVAAFRALLAEPR